MTTYTVADVDDTGATDATSAILAFVASCADGTEGARNVVRFGAAKTYRIDGTIDVVDRSHLEFDLNGSTFQTDTTGTLARSHWRFTVAFESKGPPRRMGRVLARR